MFEYVKYNVKMIISFLLLQLHHVVSMVDIAMSLFLSVFLLMNRRLFLSVCLLERFDLSDLFQSTMPRLVSFH